MPIDGGRERSPPRVGRGTIGVLGRSFDVGEALATPFVLSLGVVHMDDISDSFFYGHGLHDQKRPFRHTTTWRVAVHGGWHVCVVAN